MSKEIQEILSLLKSSSWYNEANKIEDYITNLQEENEQLESKIERAKFIYETRNTVEGKKARFFEGKHTHDLMYEVLKGE